MPPCAITDVADHPAGDQSKRGFDRIYGGEQTDGGRSLWTFNAVNFARIAGEMGAVGFRVEEPDAFGPASEKALSAGRPAVIDVVTHIDALAPLAVT